MSIFKKYNKNINKKRTILFYLTVKYLLFNIKTNNGKNEDFLVNL